MFKNKDIIFIDRYKDVMNKKIKLNNNKVRSLVKERLKMDGSFIDESKIDKVIRQYLIERIEQDNDINQTNDNLDFSRNTKKTFNNLVNNLNEIIEDIRIVQTKEPDILIESHSKEIYSESYLEEVVSKLEDIISSVEFLNNLNTNREDDNNLQY